MKQIHFIGGAEGGSRHDLTRRTADFLLASTGITAVPDLSRTLIILPGQNAIRLLTDRLAATGHGIFPPDTATSGSLIRFGITRTALTPAEQIQLWQEILKEPAAERCSALFVNGLDRTNKKLISGLAENLSTLQSELNRELLSFAAAAEILQETADFPRWQELAALEKIFREKLDRYGLPDPLQLLQDAVSDLTVFCNYNRLIIAGVPDLPGPAKKRLALLEQTSPIQIDILVDAPPEMACRFDEWGSVIPDAWSGYPLDFEHGGRNRIHVAADPAELARITRDLMPDTQGIFDCRKTIVATADPALVPWIKQELEKVHGMPEIYDPAGLTAGMLNLVPLLHLLHELMEEPRIDVIRKLFAHRCFRPWLAKTCECTENELLAALDEYRLEHLVDVLSGNSPYPRHSALQTAFGEIRKIRSRLCNSKEPAKSLRELLNSIFTHMPPPLRGVSFQQEADHFSTLLEQFTESPLLSQLPPSDFYEALANAGEKLDLYPDHAPDALEITGFLDLPFRYAERIILCGMNEGVLPESIRATNFLNDQKRKLLGLPDNAQRFARDCFYLYTILKDTPLSDFIVARTDEKGAPLRASTLFFAGSVNLEQRAGILFSPPQLLQDTQHSKPGRAFQIQPDLSHAFCSKDDPELIQLSVTGFKPLLENPLSAFFSRSMGLTLCDYEATELDNAAFGTVCHAALEHFDLHSCSTEEEALNTLVANFSRELEKKCGSSLPAAIRIQKEMFLRRMEHTARKLFAEKDHFDLLAQEWSLNGGNGILFHGARIKGKIDRIEISRDRTILRLIDFKTSDKGKSPEETHLNSKKEFVDLQLPLYRLLLPLDETFRKEVMPDFDPETITIHCGYFNIPKAVTGTGYSMWNTLEDMLPNAEQTVANTITMIRDEIRAGTLRDDPEKKHPFDDFAEFYLPNADQAVRGVRWEGEEE